MNYILAKDGDAERYLVCEVDDGQPALTFETEARILDVGASTISRPLRAISAVNHGDWEPYEVPASSNHITELKRLLGQAGLNLADLD